MIRYDMDLFTPLLLVCSLVTDTRLVSAVAAVVSDRQLYHVRNKEALRGTGYRTKVEATAAIGRASGQVYVGPLGVPLSITKEGRYSTGQILDPCRNIAVGTEYLQTFLEDCESSGQSDSRRCAVKLYAQWIGQSPEYFSQQVLTDSSRSQRPFSVKKVLPDDPAKTWVPTDPKGFAFPKPPNIPQPKLPTPPAPPSFYDSK